MKKNCIKINERRYDLFFDSEFLNPSALRQKLYKSIHLQGTKYKKDREIRNLFYLQC